MRSVSLTARAIIALVLMVGFYALALVLVAFLLWLPYAEIAYGHRLHLKLAALEHGVLGHLALPRRVWYSWISPVAADVVR